MNQDKHWQSVGEAAGDPAVEQLKKNEFQEKLPFDAGVLTEEGGNVNASRRDFLKMFGFSVSAATLAASCEIPVRKAIPYVIKPEEVTPGKALHYASTFSDGSDYCSVLVKTREGRPIKIEVNDKSGANGTNARVQASVLNLYDAERLRGAKAMGEDISWEEVDKKIGADFKAVVESGQEIVILTATILSPSTRNIFADFQAKYPTVKVVTYDAVSYSGMLEANEACFGVRNLSQYDFSKAKTIVGFAADFLGTWPTGEENTQAYMTMRRPTAKNPKMSRHIHFEAGMSLTGSNADLRATMKPSQEGMAIMNLYNNLAVLAGVEQIPNVPKIEFAGNSLGVASKELWENKGESLVLSGSNDTNIQIVVNGINNLLGNYGNSIMVAESAHRQGSDKAVNELIDSINSGNVGALFINNVNPSYSLPNADKFNEAVKKVGLTVSFNERMDETTSMVKYACPDHNYLEAWNDASPVKGQYSITQPTIQPIFKTRPMQESLLKWSDAEVTNYYEYIQNYWQANVFTKQSAESNFQNFWDKAVHDGVMRVEDEIESREFSANIVEIASNVKLSNGDGLELLLYEKMGMGDGRYSNNPFLQELPDPITRATWDNYACVSPKYASEVLGINIKTEADIREKDVIKISANGYSIELPVLIQPGQANNTIAIALGYGRTHAGRAGNGVGQNAYPFLSMINGTWQRYATGVKVEKTGKKYKLALIQTQYMLDGDLPDRTVLKDMSLAAYKKNPSGAVEKIKKYTESDHFVAIYDKPDYRGNGHHWAMAVDLNACTGCSACVVACNVENNVPVVGKEEVARAHEMHWIRIDRYYKGDVMDSDSIESAYQPMMCQHCDNAPCENVCPVAATNHSSEGLNQMAYNRCIGTRYCANNCPYKVRRFNWFDYMGADSFYIYNNDTDKTDTYTELGRMVLNPDVTVRSRGVIEKCSFCVQRIQEGKLNAKKENRKLADGDIKTACMQVCSANAIVFGDLNDPKSEVSKLYKNERTYNVLEEMHTLPSVGYMAKVRNKKENA